ncbi:MAG: M13-type metalloendopeptidase [Anaeromyxobacteraceae bacterium]
MRSTPTRPTPSTTGGSGSNLAHDMTHVVDTLGAENDVLGRPVTWWTAADKEGFEGRARCVAEQAAAFEVRPGLHLDGPRVLREAVGDLEGVRIAYAALRRVMAGRQVPTVDGFTPEQQFFIAAAQSRAETLAEEAERRQVETDSHPVSRFRAIAPLANLPGFQAAFSCGDRSPMVRPPARRCAIWVGDTHPSPL